MNKILLAIIFATILENLNSQVIERERPKEWSGLIKGGRFMDRFLPMKDGTLSSDTWGTVYVKPRFVDNGIEDSIYTYWGGKIIKDDHEYHIFVNAWYENNIKGHMGWMNSFTMHAISDSMNGPYHIDKKVCNGTNPEIYIAKDGVYCLYVLDKWKPYYYTSKNLYGPWEKNVFKIDARDRIIIDGTSNLTFAKRDDGSQIMICRGGGVWISRDGIETYYQISNKTIYPERDGRFEDPVIWKDNIQYNLIVNDWYGRVAYYLRSKDGINWVEDDGEAYTPEIAVHKDGVKEKWFKFERIKIFQDSYGRPIQANFAVCDTLKQEDKANDSHSGKNICIPLNPGMLLTIMNKSIKTNQESIDVRITGEPDFNPQKDIDFSSLHFGNNYDVNRGNGCNVTKIKKIGKDVIVTFNTKNYVISDKEFAPKIIGKDLKGNMIFGYARNPNVDFDPPILSTRKPIICKNGDVIVELTNFGLKKSSESILSIYKNEKEIFSKKINSVKPYENRIINLDSSKMEKGEKYLLRMIGKNMIHIDYEFIF